jgi:hypothetical protein
MNKRLGVSRRAVHWPLFPSRWELEAAGAMASPLDEIEFRATTRAALTGGDVDAHGYGAIAVGDEAVGGSVATPDQDAVDELGRALGVAQELDAEIVTSAERLRDRDRHRWDEEWEEAHGGR